MSSKIRDLSPKMSTPALENELFIPDTFQNTFGNVVGGLLASSKELSQGKVKIQGVDERMLFGDVEAFDTGTGVYLGKDPEDGLYKFRAGNPAGTQLYWDGSALNISGFLEDGEAAADVNANATTISGTKITTGSITAAQIAANTITASQIAANTITASQIASNTITASQIAANAITSSELAANAVIAGKIAAGAVTADEISVSTLSAISADLGTITAGSITGITITGGTIRTSASGQRVELTSSDHISVYNSSGTEMGRIYGTGGDLYIEAFFDILMHADFIDFDNGALTGIGGMGMQGDIVMNDFAITDLNRITWDTRSSNPSDSWALYMYNNSGYSLRTRMSGSTWTVDQTSA